MILLPNGIYSGREPRGLLGFAELGSGLDITGGVQVLSVTAPIGLRRSILITARLYVNTTVAGDSVMMSIRTGSTNLTGQFESHEIQFGSGTASLYLERHFLDWNPTGPKEYNMFAQRIVGTGTLTALSGATQRTILRVDDIGGL